MVAVRKACYSALLPALMLLSTQCNEEVQDDTRGPKPGTSLTNDSTRSQSTATSDIPDDTNQESTHTWQVVRPFDSASETIGSIAENDSVFVAVGRHTILTSTDGYRWHADFSDWMGKITWSGTSFFIFSSLPRSVLVSTDGAGWKEHVTDLFENLWFAEWVGRGFFVIGGGMHIETVLFSSDGFNWRPTAAYRTGTLHAIIGADSGYFGVGGAVMWSDDGADWSTVFDDSCLSLQSIATDGREYVAVGYRGDAVVSDHGLWIRIPMGVRRTYEFRRIIWTGDRFVAVGGKFDEEALIISSVDGRAWSTEYHSLTGILLDVDCISGTCVAVGEGGQLLISPE